MQISTSLCRNTTGPWATLMALQWLRGSTKKSLVVTLSISTLTALLTRSTLLSESCGTGKFIPVAGLRTFILVFDAAEQLNDKVLFLYHWGGINTKYAASPTSMGMQSSHATMVLNSKWGLISTYSQDNILSWPCPVYDNICLQHFPETMAAYHQECGAGAAIHMRIQCWP